MSKWLKSISAKKSWNEVNTNVSTRVFQQKFMPNLWMGPKIKFHDLLSRINNSLLISGTYLWNFIKTSSEINQNETSGLV